MAVKDHSLDPVIIETARKEFLDHGYQKASLHEIARKSGITTGALYTRYRSKDDLFLSLVQPLLRELQQHSGALQEAYEKVRLCPSADALLDAIHREEQVYLNLLFAHYEECVLFFCKSDGSSLEKQIQQMMAEKSRETLDFFRSIAKKDINDEGVALIMSQQFYYYRQILQHGYSREQAVSCLETVELFLEAGWKALFSSIL